MFRVLLVLISCLLCAARSIAASAGDSTQFAVAHIADSLLSGSSSVVRYSSTRMQIQGEGKAILQERRVVTVLNSDGDDEAELVLQYGRLLTIAEVKVNVYDATGHLLFSKKEGDMVDRAGTDQSTVEADRYKYLNVRQQNYPYTIDWYTEVRDYGLLSYPSFMPVQSTSTALEKAYMTVASPLGFVYRYKEYGVSVILKESSSSDGYTRNWSMGPMCAKKYETWCPPIHWRVPHVALAPQDFRMGSVEGKISEWADLGAWYCTINADKMDLNDAEKAAVKDYASTFPTQLDKVSAVYAYMQKRTRYTGLQKNMAGFVSMPASHVSRKGWGDCKALTNYTKALLDACGIPSFPVLLAAQRQSRIDPQFARNQFNHVLLAVPVSGDTLFLECTSQSQGAGYLSPRFNGFRKGLLCLPSGSHLIDLRGPAQNKLSRTLKIQVGRDGKGIGSFGLATQGGLYEAVSALQGTGEQGKLEFVNESLEMSGASLSSVTLALNEVRESGSLRCMLDLPTYGGKAGEKLLIRRCIPLTSVFKSLADTNRTLPLWLSYNREYADTVLITLPQEMKPSRLPLPIVVDLKEMGSLSANCTEVGGQVLFQTSIQLRTGSFSPHQAVSLAKGLNKLEQYYQTTLVLAPRTP